MTPELWLRVTEAFGEALGTGREDRPAAVRERCGCDATLHDAVARLLEHHDRAAGFLEQPAGLSLADCRYVFGSGDAFHSGDTVAGRYRLDEELGAGAAGVVWKANDSRLDGKAVAIKLMHPYWLSTRWMRMRFAQEMRALARLRHPNTVSVLDYEETESGQAYLVMELVEGQTLRTCLSHGRMAIGDVVSLVRQIAEVIDAAHACGVLHRDLKPENIMVTGAGAIKVLDFGVACVTGPNENGAVHSSLLAGTPGYMAPEQVFGRSTAASDRFSLGAIAYEMLAGRRPFPRANPAEMFDERKSPAAASLRELRPDLPAEVGGVIASMLRVDPARRPATARAFAESLESALHGRGRRWPARREVVVGGLCAAMSVGAGWAVWEDNGWGPLNSSESRFHWDFSRDLVDAPGNPGFQKVGNIVDGIEWSPTGQRDWLRLSSSSMGYYDRFLTRRQRRNAWQSGWVLRAGLLPLEGWTFLSFNMVEFGPRVDLVASVHPSGGTLIELPDAIVPQLRGAQIIVPRTRDALHRVEMRFDGRRKTASLVIDGKQVADGYRGHTQYQISEGRTVGLFLGVAKHQSSTGGIGFFGDLGLEIL